MPASAPIPLTLLLDNDNLELTIVNMHKKKLRALEVSDAKVQVVGLSIAGFVDHLYKGRIQLFGKSEKDYCDTLTKKELHRKVDIFLSAQPVAVVFTAPVQPPDYFIEIANKYNVPVFQTKKPSSIFLDYIKDYLNNALATYTQVHAQLLEIFGVGLLMMGKSGIGKSETTLDLVLRGHKMISDDVVEVKFIPPNHLIGQANDMMGNLLEIRGIGLIDLQRMFGITAVTSVREIDAIVELISYEDVEDYDYERIGSVTKYKELLGVSKPYYVIPVRHGSNLSAVIEATARDFLLKEQGINVAEEFEKKLDKILQQHGEN
ncbi:HPr(Ser) kinase/phosphatase [bacterium]|nr:HPr(Ser) kinase/phosphatase [bacterium]